MGDASNEWPGLMTDADPHDIPGSRVQDNCQSMSPGSLTARGGIREAYFVNSAARGAAVSDITTLPNILAVGLLRRPEGDYCVFLDSSGNLMAGRGAT